MNWLARVIYNENPSGFWAHFGRVLFWAVAGVVLGFALAENLFAVCK